MQEIDPEFSESYQPGPGGREVFETDALGAFPPDIVAPPPGPADSTEADPVPELADWELEQADPEPRVALRAPLGGHVAAEGRDSYDDDDGWVPVDPTQSDTSSSEGEEGQSGLPASVGGGQKPPTDEHPPTDFAEPSPDGGDPGNNEPEETRLTPVTPEHTQQYMTRLYENAGLEPTASADEVLEAAKAKWAAAETVDDKARVMELLTGRRVDERELRALPQDLLDGTSKSEDTFADFVEAISPRLDNQSEESAPPQDASSETGGETYAVAGDVPSDQPPQTPETESVEVARPQKLSEIIIPFDEYYPEVSEAEQAAVAQEFGSLAEDLLLNNAGSVHYIEELQEDFLLLTVSAGDETLAAVGVVSLNEAVELDDDQFPPSEQVRKIIWVTDFDEHGESNMQVRYRLYADGVVRRWDIDVAADTRIRNEFDQAQVPYGTSPREVIAITGGRGPEFEKWLRETLPNQRLAQEMGVQNRPVTLQELERLAAFVTQTSPLL